jgi:hypothetical protein
VYGAEQVAARHEYQGVAIIHREAPLALLHQDLLTQEVATPDPGQAAQGTQDLSEARAAFSHDYVCYDTLHANELLLL